MHNEHSIVTSVCQGRGCDQFLWRVLRDNLTAGDQLISVLVADTTCGSRYCQLGFVFARSAGRGVETLFCTANEEGRLFSVETLLCVEPLLQNARRTDPHPAHDRLRKLIENSTSVETLSTTGAAVIVTTPQDTTEIDPIQVVGTPASPDLWVLAETERDRHTCDQRAS